MKLVSYNIHKGMDEFRRITLLQIIRYIKSLDCDVICLQEVLYYQFVIMKLILRMDGVFGLHVNNKKMKYGICILSKNKIEGSEHLLLSSKKEQRGLLSININNETIINTHLGLDYEERKNQISEILSFAKKRGDKVIICGDFNEENIIIGFYQDIAKYFYKDKEATYKNVRIDYIFSSPKIKIKSYIVENVYYSDHFPVIVEVQDIK